MRPLAKCGPQLTGLYIADHGTCNQHHLILSQSWVFLYMYLRPPLGRSLSALYRRSTVGNLSFTSPTYGSSSRISLAVFPTQRACSSPRAFWPALAPARFSPLDTVS